MFGKSGRPPEDRLLRQREIYLAVTPLILAMGVRRLSMRDAAHVACLSIGGLYHYFPTKRDLVLHGLTLAARDRICQKYRARLAMIASLSTERYLDVYLDEAVEMFQFIRPAAWAALELGETELQTQLDAGLMENVTELGKTLRGLAPDISDADLNAMGRALRRLALGMLLDREAPFDELRDQFRALIEGYLVRSHTSPIALTA